MITNIDIYHDDDIYKGNNNNNDNDNNNEI